MSSLIKISGKGANIVLVEGKECTFELDGHEFSGFCTFGKIIEFFNKHSELWEFYNIDSHCNVTSLEVYVCVLLNPITMQVSSTVCNGGDDKICIGSYDRKGVYRQFEGEAMFFLNWASEFGFIASYQTSYVQVDILNG
jgi:hypothetical protein